MNNHRIPSNEVVIAGTNVTFLSMRKAKLYIKEDLSCNKMEFELSKDLFFYSEILSFNEHGVFWYWFECEDGKQIGNEDRPFRLEVTKENYLQIAEKRAKIAN